MSGSGGALDAVAWPRDRLGDAMFALARRAGLSPRPVEPAAPPEEIVGSTGLPLERWMESAARWLGLEAELVAGPLADLGAQIASAAPALVRVGERARFLAVLSADARDVALLAPDLSVKRLPIARVAGALREEDEAPFRDAVDRLIAIAGVPPGRAERARAAIVAEQLRARGGRRVWHLRLPPGADLARQLRRAGLHRRLATYAGTHLAGYGLWLLSWWLVGRGALQDRLDGGWLSAWALLLFTLIPVRLISAWAGGALAIDAGALVKRRLLAGALALEPDEIRHAGAGQLLGRVIESDELQTLALEGGLSSLAAAIDLIAATAVIAAGAGGVGQAALLAIWTLFTAILAWRYLRRRARWTDDRLAMTHELVERMVGHRTRLAQERPDRWHDGEDHALLRYLDRGRDLDRAAIALTGFVPRGWMVAGVLGLAPAFVAGGSAAPAIAVAIGGVLLGHQALRTLVAGLSQLAGAAVAWRQIQPLYRAAARADLAPPVADAPKTTDEQPGEPALLEAYGVVYRHGDRAEPVLRGCDLQIHAGDRLLLEGASGSGKSTLASILAGLRSAQQGLLLLSGLDRSTLGMEGWRRRVVAAPQFQENHVLTGTFAFNLLMGRAWPPRARDLEEAEAICEKLDLGGLLARMPAGMQQIVGETGWRLSHGERSRLYIARALLQGADVVVLDESFAALDPETLGRALGCAMEQAPALLVIAHP